MTEEDKKLYKMNMINVGKAGSAKEVALALMDLYAPCSLDYHEALAMVLAVTKLTTVNINLDKIDTKRFSAWSLYLNVYRHCGILKRYRKEIPLSQAMKKSIIVEDGIVIECKSSLVNLYDVVQDDKVIQYRNIPQNFDFFDPEPAYLGNDPSEFDRGKKDKDQQSSENSDSDNDYKLLNTNPALNKNELLPAMEFPLLEKERRWKTNIEKGKMFVFGVIALFWWPLLLIVFAMREIRKMTRYSLKKRHQA